MNPYVVSFPFDRITCSAATMLNEVLAGYDARFVEGFGQLPVSVNGAIVVFHGQHESKKMNVAEHLMKLASPLDWVIWVSLGDEWCEFPYEVLVHKNQILWVQSPKPGKVIADRYLIEGYHPNTLPIIHGSPAPVRDLDWFFAGQVTHLRREQCVNALLKCQHGMLLETRGFFQGMPSEEFYKNLRRAKIAPCPAGPGTPDSFRFAEALECGAVPILDAFSPDGVKGYWDMVLGAHPFEVIEDWSTLPDVMAKILGHYEEQQRLTQYWWKRYKMALRTLWLSQDLMALGAV